ncbi:MAG: SocA family protein [Candidatus Cloacimonetes bacterium]|nr:SocA family protein [Candidatus Cloacimonadota bacterium]MCK9504873.1 Panacea domain-containing protein [Porticoccaceae bacterium]
MSQAYNDNKAVQAAAIFIDLEGGTIDKYKLCKLMYYLERQTLVLTGQLLFHSDLFSIKHGPVASEVNDAINTVLPSENFRPLFSDQYSRWFNYFKKVSKYGISSVANPGDDELSEADIDLIKEISVQFENYDHKQLKAFFDNLPEHTKTDTRIPISFEDILKAEGFPEEEIEELREEYSYYLELISA